MKGFANKDLLAAIKRSKANKKTFLDWCGPEDHFQHSVILWIQLQYPKIKIHHSPDSGRRSAFEQFKYKYLGGQSGFPDLLLFYNKKMIAIELKVGKNTPSFEQTEWLNFLNECNIPAKCCYDFDEAMNFITNEFKLDNGKRNLGHSTR